MTLKLPARSERTVQKGRITHFDADSVLYISDDENEDVSFVLHSVKLILQRVKEETECEHLQPWLSSPENFRYGVYPEYKSNRKGVPKPFWFTAIREYLIKYHGAAEARLGFEADDEIAYRFLEGNDSNAVASFIDKDFFCFPGKKHKWKNKGSGFVFETDMEDADSFLAFQLLTGDKQVDWIISPLKAPLKSGSLGKTGYGAGKARDFLLKYNTAAERMQAVKELYEQQGYFDQYEVNWKLLAIGRTEI